MTYYESKVKYGNNEFYIVINVGKTKNDGQYHIYDLTRPKQRNTADRINGLARPVGNVLENGVSTNSITDNSQNVNTQLEDRDNVYMQAVENGDTETAQKLVDDVVYDLVANEQKERTDKWLKALGLQLPSAITKYGSINNISENSQNVNAQNENRDNAYMQATFREKFCM